MSARQTKFPKNSNRSIHQGTTIIGKNGLPVDALATLEPGTSLIRGAQAVTYSQPTVTVPLSVDLSNIININPEDFKHTGILLFTDASKASYIIDPSTINNITKTFNVYIDEDYTTSPSSIDLKKDWVISEGELVNRLQTTSQAVIDAVEFRDVDIHLQLDKDPVRVVDSDGDELNINPDGSINTTVSLSSLTAPVIANIPLILANTEYSYTFPTNTKKFRLNVRGNAKLQFAFISGNTNTQYISVFPGNSHEETGLNIASTIYFQSNKANEVIEILSWS